MRTFKILTPLAAFTAALVTAACGGGADDELGETRHDIRLSLPVQVVLKDFTTGMRGLSVSEFKSLNAEFSDSRYTVAVFNVLAMEKGPIVSAAKIELAKGKTVMLDSDGSNLGRDRVEAISMALAGSGEKNAAVAHTQVAEDRISSIPVTFQQLEAAAGKTTPGLTADNAQGNYIKSIFPAFRETH